MNKTLLSLTAGILTGLASLTSGCAFNTRLYVTSDPEYASIIQNNGIRIAKCPEVISYDLNSTDRQRGYINVRLKAVWPSGAETDWKNITLSAKGLEPYTSYNFSRPRVSGREIDANYAIEKERNEIYRAEQESQNNANEQRAILNSQRYLRTLRPLGPGKPLIR